MAVFPATPKPNYPVEIEPEWAPLISRVDTGGEQRKQKSLFPRYNVRLTYKALSNANLQTLWEFYHARKGAYEAFYFFDLISLIHIDQYVCTGDGTTEIFDLPGKSTSSHKIYYNGILQTLTTDYVILTCGGDGDADRVDFVSPPAAGAVITTEFAGYLRIRARFEEDKLNRQMFYAHLYTTGISLKGLKAA